MNFRMVLFQFLSMLLLLCIVVVDSTRDLSWNRSTKGTVPSLGVMISWPSKDIGWSSLHHTTLWISESFWIRNLGALRHILIRSNWLSFVMFHDRLRFKCNISDLSDLITLPLVRVQILISCRIEKTFREIRAPVSLITVRMALNLASVEFSCIKVSRSRYWLTIFTFVTFFLWEHICLSYRNWWRLREQTKSLTNKN